MRDHFKHQLKSAKPMDADDIKSLNVTKSIYHGDLEPGDELLFFMEQTVLSCTKDVQRLALNMVTCTERDLDELKGDYEFIRNTYNNIPVLKKI